MVLVLCPVKVMWLLKGKKEMSLKGGRYRSVFRLKVGIIISNRSYSIFTLLSQNVDGRNHYKVIFLFSVTQKGKW